MSGEGLVFRVTKKLTQFFFSDILDGDRNRLAENLVVGANACTWKDCLRFPFLLVHLLD